MAEKAGRSIWNCKSSAVSGLANPPFKYRARSASQVSPNARQRNKATCGQLTFDGVMTDNGVRIEGCEVVCMMISLS